MPNIWMERKLHILFNFSNVMNFNQLILSLWGLLKSVTLTATRKKKHQNILKLRRLFDLKCIRRYMMIIRHVSSVNKVKRIHCLFKICISSNDSGNKSRVHVQMKWKLLVMEQVMKWWQISLLIIPFTIWIERAICVDLWWI